MEHMEYITAKEAAVKWNISLRRVQKLCEQKRICGTKKLGRAWMLPAGTEKPADPRREKPPQKNISSELARIITSTIAPLPIHNPDAILDIVKDDWVRLQYEAELAYLRGDFQRTMHCFYKTGAADEAIRLRACLVAVAAVISMGDYRTYTEIDAYLKEKAGHEGYTAVFAELSLVAAAVSCIAPNLAPEWLREGDFGAVPMQLRYYALYLRVKYFQCIKNYEAMLSAAQAALTLCEPENGFTTTGIYLRMCCAVACHALEQKENARKFLLETMRIALPHGFITPFAENVTAFGGLIEQCLLKEFPNHYDAVIRQWMRTFQNWIIFHNQFTNDNLTLVLSLREYHIAQMVARRIPYAKIAEQQCISVGRVKNIMMEVYEKLFISGREELAKYVF
jgi:DNA-binding CsgD family transcriptional regulator